MKSALAFLSLLAVAVSSSPLELDSHLVKEGDVNGRLSLFHRVTYVEGEKPGYSPGASAKRLTFALLVPKLGRLDDLKDGFSSRKLGDNDSDSYTFFKLDDDEEGRLVDLVGLSDPKKWLAVLVKLWTLKGVVVKAFSDVKEDDGKLKRTPYSTVDELVDFVRKVASLPVLKGLLDKGVASHLFTHRLHLSLSHLL